MSLFQKASKKQAKLRAAVFGPSGGGKTYTSLCIAKGLGGKVAVIDTERGSASKYSDRFDFDVCDLEKKDVASYCKTIKAAYGYDVLIIDSLTHAWQELLEQVEKLAQAKYRGNTWSAWSEGTPLQRDLVDAILDFPGHVIATMRSKTEWTTAKQDNGKSAPVRVGLAPEQGKGIEYEFDLLLELTVDHVGNVLKDRTGKFQDKLIDKPGEEFGKELAAWLSEGTVVEPVEKKDPHSKTVKKYRDWIISKSPAPDQSTDLEILFCVKASESMPERRQRERLEEFTLDEFGLLASKREEVLKEILANATPA